MTVRIRTVSALVTLVLVWSVGVAFAQSAPVPLRVEISSTFRDALRPGSAGEVTLTLTNLLPQREVVLRAEATFMIGNQSMSTVSNEVRLSIDDSITVTQLRLSLSNLTNINVRDASGRSVNVAINGGDLILNSIVVGQREPVVLKISGNVAIAPTSP